MNLKKIIDKINITLLFFCVIMFFSDSSWAATYYMRSDGVASKANSEAGSGGGCGATSTAMNESTHNAATFDGDTIYLCDDGGSFSAINPLDYTTKNTTYENAPGDSPQITSGGTCVQGQDVDNITFRGITIGPCGGSGFYIWESNEFTLEDCTIYDINNGMGVLGWERTPGTVNNHWIIRRNKIYDVGDACSQGGGRCHNLYMDDIDNAVIEYNELYDNTSGTGIHFNQGPLADWSENTIVRYNYIHDCFNGVDVYATDGVKIYGNVFEEMDFAHFWIAYETSAIPAKNTEAYNNTFIQKNANLSSGAMIYAYSYTHGHIFKNNIFDIGSNNADYIIYARPNAPAGDIAVMENNKYYSTVYTGKWSYQGTTYSTASAWNAGEGFSDNTNLDDPLFTDPDTSDYTLQSDSPCIDAGSDLGNALYYCLDPASTWPDSVLPVDCDSFGAAGWPIGAYEYDADLTNNISIWSGSLSISSGSATIK